MKKKNVSDVRKQKKTTKDEHQENKTVTKQTYHVSVNRKVCEVPFGEKFSYDMLTPKLITSYRG